MSTAGKTEAHKSDDTLLDLVRTLARDLDAKVAFICQPSESDPEKAHTVALCVDDQFLDNLEYKVAGTPCERVYEKGSLSHASNVTDLYPDDDMLAEWNIESYVGYALYDSEGEVLGHLGVLDEKPMADTAKAQSRLRELATQAVQILELRKGDAGAKS